VPTGCAVRRGFPEPGAKTNLTAVWNEEDAMRARLLLCGFLMCLLAWPAVSSGQDAVVVYSSVDEENAKKLLDAFTKATNIKVRFTFLSSGPAVARIEAEKNNP
jgi:iron(III) transport system substrate-binding protein